MHFFLGLKRTGQRARCGDAQSRTWKVESGRLGVPQKPPSHKENWGGDLGVCLGPGTKNAGDNDKGLLSELRDPWRG